MKVVIIAGPTAAGKTYIAHHLAKLYNGEIICADSCKVYRLLNIGTAKPSIQLRKEINYHLIDVADITEDFSVYRFKVEAEGVILRGGVGRLHFVVGGCGLYIKALTEGLFHYPGPSHALRKELMQQQLTFGKNYLYNELLKIDPTTAEKLHPNDLVRIIRAIEVYRLTGLPISYHKQYLTQKPTCSFLKLFINIPKELLLTRIKQRIQRMINEGFIDEVIQLRKLYPDNLIRKRAIGYGEIIDYLMNNISLTQAIDNITTRTKKLAKQQITWFKSLNFIPVADDLETISHIISEYLAS